MFLHKNPSYTFYFGDQTACVAAVDLNSLVTHNDTMLMTPFAHAQRAIDAERLAFLHQIHSIEGLSLTRDTLTTHIPFRTDGDFLTTNMPHIGLGILTADCLPIIFYDPAHHALALAHAGWRGSVAGIGPAVVAHMHTMYGSRPEELQIFFGPSAHVCCYEVSADFIDTLGKHGDLAETVIRQNNDRFYFDLPAFNLQLLTRAGINKDLCNLDYNCCTICNPTWCSYRRDGSQAGRQITAITLL